MTNSEDINKELKRLRDDAILNPTEQHVHQYLKAHNWIFNKSATFADVARRVIWANPDVDYNNRKTVVSMSRQNDDVRRFKATRQNIRDLSQDYGLVFFARSDCPYCHDQAPILKYFESEFGMSVLAISMDGGRIPQYPEAKQDNGISMIVSSGAGISTVPAIYLVKRSTSEAIPLGSGVLAAEDIKDRIWVMTKTKPGEEF